MNINADFSQRVVVSSEHEPWVASPLPGVERRMLDRIGDEVARATSIVRYAPNSSFSAHTHDGGEEFFVLNGIFSDEHGDYGPGTYVRNPPGSKHRPSSAGGCTIFVKLRQMLESDETRVCIDTSTAVWQSGPAAGVETLPLYQFGAEQVSLQRWRAETRLPAYSASGGEEIFVRNGSFANENGRYPQGAWLRHPPGWESEPFTVAGCTLYIKRGHLTDVIGAEESRR
ncbi:MAG: cupin domain-containing protein [Gammaproteobacteria bacterium]|nr:cupin domain-containing protein [Gammaproteobacteria bacterium]